MHLGAPLCSAASNSSHDSTVCTGEGPRANPTVQNQRLSLLEGLSRSSVYHPACSAGEMVAQGSQGTSPKSQKPGADMGGNPRGHSQSRAPRKCCIFFFCGTFFPHSTTWPTWDSGARWSWGCPGVGKTQGVSAMGVWWVFLGGRSWRDGRKWSK